MWKDKSKSQIMGTLCARVWVVTKHKLADTVPLNTHACKCPNSPKLSQTDLLLNKGIAPVSWMCAGVFVCEHYVRNHRTFKWHICALLTSITSFLTNVSCLKIAVSQTHTQRHALGGICGIEAQKPLSHLRANITPRSRDHVGGLGGFIHTGAKINGQTLK